MADKKSHPFAKDGFEYRTAYFKDLDGTLYRLTVSVGKNSGINTVYNIGKMAQKKTPQVFGATKAQIAQVQSPSAEVTEADNNSFGFKFASSELNRIGSIGSIAYENGKVNISGVPFSEVVGQKNKKAEAYHQPDTTNRPKATAKTDGELTTAIDNYIPQNGENVKFSMGKAVEETKDLVAVHNVDEKALERSLKLGGLPMPSIAVIKAEQGHSKYGPISLVFGRDTIDPQLNSENRVYGGDGWTPTKAPEEYEVNYDAARQLEKALDAAAKKVAGGIFDASSALRRRGIDGTTEMGTQEIAEKLAKDDGVRAAYLAEQGTEFEPIMQEKAYNRKYGNDALEQFTEKIGEKRLQEIHEALTDGVPVDEALGEDAEKLRSVIHDYYAKSQEALLARQAKKMGWSAEETRRKGEQRIARTMENAVTPFVLEDFAQDAWRKMTDTDTVGTEIDRTATSDKLRDAVDDDRVAAWVEEQLDGVLGKAGIYNGK